METAYYRHLFRNENDCIVQAGSVLIKETKERFIYTYIAGAYHQREIPNWENDIKIVPDGEDAQLDLCVFGSYTYPGVTRLIRLLERYHTKTVVFPYAAPIQRLFLASRIPADYPYRESIMKFLDSPYDYIKSKGVEEIYCLYGENDILPENGMILKEGAHFDLASSTALSHVERLEGHYMPIVRCGYLKWKQFIFYLGYFGPNYDEVGEFMQKYFDRKAGLMETLESVNNRFGRNPYGCIVMYHGPIDAKPSEVDSVMMAKPWSPRRGCKPSIALEGMPCEIECHHKYDYAVMRHHTNRKRNRERMAILLLGNLDMKRYYKELRIILQHHIDKIRTIGVPDCGSGEDWESQILDDFVSDDTLYWIIPMRQKEPSIVLQDILDHHIYHRAFNINSEKGFCISGFMAASNRKK